MLSADGHVVLTIDEPMDQIIAPFDRVGVELVSGAVNFDVHARLLVERPLKSVVRRQKHALSRRAGIHDLHNVELAAASPSAIRRIGG